MFILVVWVGLPGFAAVQRDTLSAFETVLADRESGADALRQSFRLIEAISEYEALLQLQTDPIRVDAIRRKLTETRRGVIMMDYCHNPEPVAKRRLPLKDFLLFYPFKNGSWRQLPNPFDASAPDALIQAVYAPKGQKDVFFTARDAAGCRNIYLSRDRDSLWSAPTLLGESLVSVGNEIYPILSPDGQTLYFASDGLYGMGGYDLYKSVYNEASDTWGAPENMGFPYNSPGDDFLMMGSEDGKYAIFASNRECSRDSVCLYVLDFSTLDREIKISSEAELSALALLQPSRDPKRLDNDSISDRAQSSTDGTLAYREQMNVVRTLKDRIYRCEKTIDEIKVSGSATEADTLLALEKLLPVLRDSLARENEKVHAIESEFLRSGVVSSRGEQPSDREVVGAGSGYTFTKHTYGSKLKITFAAPENDGSVFSVDPVGRFARTLPQGTCYQIRFMDRLYHASLDDLRGLNPVYERLTPDLRYAYSVGVFPTLQAALSALNRVRVLGFPDARIVKVRDGREVEF